MKSSLAPKQFISATQTVLPFRSSDYYDHHTNHSRRCKIGYSRMHFRIFNHSMKKPYLKEFQDYAKPSRLFPVSEVKTFWDSSLENLVSVTKGSRSEALYIVKLQTSSSYGSGLTDMNSGILLCLIDEEGNSILHRIPACLFSDDSRQSEDDNVSNFLHFQQGSVDEFVFEGPRLGKLAAVWIGLESGEWRPGGLSISVIGGRELLAAGDSLENMQFGGLRYDFDVEELLLGEDSDTSVMQLRPCSITELSGDNFNLLTGRHLDSPSPTVSRTTNKESMKEYADLKFSLLIYDILLTVTGSYITSIPAGEDAAVAFLTGGIGGFLYLFVLQRSVDGLPASELVSTNKEGNVGVNLNRFRGSIASLVLVFGLAIIVAKYASGDMSKVLTPKDLIFGMLGFLMSKVSAVLAAFKPISVGSSKSE